MAEKIQQELGFDASQAIQTLTALDKVMASFEQRLGQSVKAMDAFNKKGGATVGMLKKVATEGNRAATALAKVVSLQAQAGAAPGGARAGAGGALAVPGVDQYVKQLQTMYKVSDRASDSQKRAFQSAITGAAEMAAKNKVSMGQVISQSKNLDKSFTGVANTMANKLSRIEQASKKHLNAAGQSVRKLSVDFQTMVRIVTTQAIVRALSQLRNVIRGAVSDATEFQTRIAEIGTIAPTDDLADLGQRVRELSDEFNTPLDTTAKGYYQTISNQIGQTTDDFDKFVSAASKFSKTSVTDLASATDLGTGALNAFGKTAEDAENTFAKFFVTIKQGRVIGQELAQGFGTVAPLAGKLGVEFEEVNAALATITIQGISADKAFTQLRGVFNSFLKPTEEMTAALKELGFSSGQELLRAHDLQEALKLVVGTTDGTAEAVAKLIPRIRGLTGGLALLSDETEHFTETMDLQQKQAEELFDRGYEMVIETDAFKVTKELNELTNFLTTEFGQGVLEASANLFEFVGGAEGVKRVLTSVGAVLPEFIVLVGAAGTAMAVMAVKAKLATAGLAGMVGPLGLLVAIPAAMAAGEYLAQNIIDGWDAEYQAFKETMEKELELRQKKINAEIALEKQKVGDLEQTLAQGLVGVQKFYFEAADAAIDANDKALASIKFFTDGMISEASRAASAAKSAAENAGKNVLASEERVGKLRSSIDDKIFSNRIRNQDEINKVYALTNRSAQLASSAAKQLREATTEDERATADEEFRRAEAFASQALSIAQGTDNLALEAKALGSLESLTNANIRAEQTYQKTLADSQIEQAKRAQTEERRVEKLKAQQKDLLEAFTLYDKETGELLTGPEREQKLKGAHDQLLDFIQTAQEGKPLDVGQMLNFATVSQQMAQEMDVFRIQEIQVAEAAIQNLSDQFTIAIERAYAQAPAAGFLEALTGIKVETPTTGREALVGTRDEYTALIETAGEYKKATDLASTQTDVLKGALAEIQQEANTASVLFATLGAKVKDTLGSTSDYQVIEGMSNALKLMNQAAEGGEVPLESIKEAVAALVAVEGEAGFTSRILTGDIKKDVANAILALNELAKTQERIAEIRAEDAGGRTYEEVLQRLEQFRAVGGVELQDMLYQPALDAQSMSTALGTSLVATTDAVSPASQLDAHWRSIADSAERAAVASAGVGTPAANRAAGGPMRYLASGGFARGMDQIPAMLTKDEFVTNAKSSRKFYSQLSAMNAGVQPVFRESGGTVTNVGDVSINVTEASSSKQTARDVMNAFRRETRRGSGRL